MDMDMLTAFDEWLTERSETLALSMTMVARASASFRLRFDGIIDCIEVLVLADEVVVLVEHEGFCWDLLAEFGCASVLALGGGLAGLCDPDDRQAYPTNAAMFVGHVFEPLAEWVAASLIPARSLGLGGSRQSGSTWAGLLPADQTKDYNVILPLRTLTIH
jgi:hypothetical protein